LNWISDIANSGKRQGIRNMAARFRSGDLKIDGSLGKDLVFSWGWTWKADQDQDAKESLGQCGLSRPN
jgi:hypothetical protein